jgi:hypothetical protein
MAQYWAIFGTIFKSFPVTLVCDNRSKWRPLWRQGDQIVRLVDWPIVFLGQRPLVPLLLIGPPFFLMILFGSTTLLTGTTGISLHMQWPLTSQSQRLCDCLLCAFF